MAALRGYSSSYLFSIWLCLHAFIVLLATKETRMQIIRDEDRGTRIGGDIDPLFSLKSGSFGKENKTDRFGNGISPKVTYEETVYGGRSGHTQNAGVPENGISNYAHVLLRDAVSSVKERIHNEYTTAFHLRNVIDSRPYRYVSNFLNAKPYAKVIAKSGMVGLEGMKLVKKRFQLESNELWEMANIMHLDSMFYKQLKGTFSPDFRPPVPPDIDFCPYPRSIICDKFSKFRTLDGSCNNLQDPIIGRELTPFKRFLPPVYNDGIEEARLSVLGGPLPGARHVSRSLFLDKDRPSRDTTVIMVFFGQLIDHDLTRTAITEVLAEPDEGPVGETVELKCGQDGCEANKPGLEACWPIPVPEDDADFPYNRCIKFVRDVEVPSLSCHIGPREQLNQPTHWLDTSMIYGGNLEEAESLRDTLDRKRGKMAVLPHPLNGASDQYKPLPPHADFSPLCRETNETIKCFKAGDERINENAGLATIQTVFMRQHNFLEDQLHLLNPHWDGERLFQETRRIMAATIQHITFNELLPVLFGPELMRQLGLELVRDGYYYGYDDTIDGRIPNSFASAAFRFGHTLLQEKLNRVSSQLHTDDSLFLSMTFHRPLTLYELGDGKGIDGFIRGLSAEASQTYDTFFTKQITKSLFSEKPPFGPGMDLISLNIQRGRDHGLPSYTEYRDFCGFGRAKSFEDLAFHIKDRRALKGLEKVYNHVDDIDLFPGGISETSVDGGVLGPTFACIIGRTFRGLRDGDRFWYENNNSVGFTSEQLKEIRKVTFAKILCENSDNVQLIQPQAFLQPSSSRYGENPRMPCESLPFLDASKWQEGPYTF